MLCCQPPAVPHSLRTWTSQIPKRHPYSPPQLFGQVIDNSRTNQKGIKPSTDLLLLRWQVDVTQPSVFCCLFSLLRPFSSHSIYHYGLSWWSSFFVFWIGLGVIDGKQDKLPHFTLLLHHELECLLYALQLFSHDWYEIGIWCVSIFEKRVQQGAIITINYEWLNWRVQTFFRLY